MRISDWSSDVCSSDLSIVVGSVEREFLDGGVHFEQHLALAVVAHQALDPEEGGEPGAAGHRLDAVKAARGIEDGIARGQSDIVVAKGVADDQPPSLIIPGVVEEASAGQVGAQWLSLRHLRSEARHVGTAWGSHG